MDQVHWLAVWWTIVSTFGCFYTARNFYEALLDYRFLLAARERASLLVVAYTPVRSHALMLSMHLTFMLAGIVAVEIPFESGQTPFPTTIYGWLLNLILLAIPHLLIVMSYTIHEDRLKATRLAAVKT